MTYDEGQPTVHKAFDEATAILAGDALLTLSFDLITSETGHPDPAVRARLANLLGPRVGNRRHDWWSSPRYRGRNSGSVRRRHSVGCKR